MTVSKEQRMIKARTMTRTQSEQHFVNYESSPTYEASVRDQNYHRLHYAIHKSYYASTDKFDGFGNMKYLRDLELGLNLYEFYENNPEFEFNIRIASNPEYWIFIHTLVSSNVVRDRWQDNWENSHTHVYSQVNRIWLMSLWWYIHLSWQGDRESTYDVLKDFTTDTILNLVERTGDGYDVELTREIILQVSKKSMKNKTNYFRRVMVLNTSYLKTLTPQLFNGGVESYVLFLIEKVEETL